MIVVVRPSVCLSSSIVRSLTTSTVGYLSDSWAFLFSFLSLRTHRYVARPWNEMGEYFLAVFSSDTALMPHKQNYVITFHLHDSLFCILQRRRLPIPPSCA